MGRQPWALSLPDKELCLREALAVLRILLAVRESIVWILKLLFERQLQSYTERIRLSVPLFFLCSFTHRI